MANVVKGTNAVAKAAAPLCYWTPAAITKGAPMNGAAKPPIKDSSICRKVSMSIPSRYPS